MQKPEATTNDPEEILRMRMKSESEVKITTSYRILHEPSIQFSPQMRKINNYYGGGYCDEVKDEFEMVKKLVTAGDVITYEEFLKVVMSGESKRIALIGGAGYGKSTEMRKLAKNLLHGEGQNENKSNLVLFNIVHVINFKDMRPEESTTLQDCLFENIIPNADDRKHLLERIEKNQSNTIILIDGLDQAPYDTKLEHHKVPYWKEASTETLMYNLMSGNIFPDVKVVISSREHAISILPEEARPEYVVALAGFKKEHAKSLFLDLVQDDNESWNNIELNLGDLLSVLVVPIYLIFTAVVYKHSIKKSEDIPTYVTGLLAKIIGILPNSKHMQETIIDILQKLKKLAYDGMKDRLLSFDEVYLNNRGLSANEVSDLLSKVPTENYVFHRLLEKDYFYFFCHQSMEEFLAACYILEMSLVDFKSFTEHAFAKEYGHWSNVIQYLSGMTFNQKIQLGQNPNQISDKKRKQEQLRDVLRRPPTNDIGNYPPAYFMALHESNDDELIRQLKKITMNTPLTSHSARVISSLMRRSESMKAVGLWGCGVTNELLLHMATNMKGCHLQIKNLWLYESEWDVTCSTLNSFLANLKVNELALMAFPTDYHDDFPDFENVTTIKMWIHPYNVIVTNERDRILFEYNGMPGEFNKKEKLLTLHFELGWRNDEGVDDLVMKLKNLCSAEKAEVIEE